MNCVVQLFPQLLAADVLLIAAQGDCSLRDYFELFGVIFAFRQVQQPLVEILIFLNEELTLNVLGLEAVAHCQQPTLHKSILSLKLGILHWAYFQGSALWARSWSQVAKPIELILQACSLEVGIL